jgi:hypothetical protein
MYESDVLMPMNRDQQNEADAHDQMPSWREVFLYFLFLGFVNVGGPVAQITMMFNHMVESGVGSRGSFHQGHGFLPHASGRSRLAICVGYLKRRCWAAFWLA